MPANLVVDCYRNEVNASDTLRQNIAYFISHQVQKEVLYKKSITPVIIVTQP